MTCAPTGKPDPARWAPGEKADSLTPQPHPKSIKLAGAQQLRSYKLGIPAGWVVGKPTPHSGSYLQPNSWRDRFHSTPPLCPSSGQSSTVTAVSQGGVLPQPELRSHPSCGKPPYLFSHLQKCFVIVFPLGPPYDCFFFQFFNFLCHLWIDTIANLNSKFRFLSLQPTPSPDWSSLAPSCPCPPQSTAGCNAGGG